MITTLLLAQILSSGPAPATVPRIGGGTQTLSDIAGPLDRERKAGRGKPGTFSAAESTAPRQAMPLVIPSESGAVVAPAVVTASEASTGWYVYGPGGTRTYYYYSHAPTHIRTPASHATGHATARKHY